MPEYRRMIEPGGIFFFTIVTFNRVPLFINPKNRDLLHAVWKQVQLKHPFITVAICLLPEHIHTIWKLPEGDSNYPMRIKEIKRIFTKHYLEEDDEFRSRNASRLHQGEAAIWQRRYWEHTIRDEKDLEDHIDYVHYNPIKHGLVSRLADWPWSSFHKYSRDGLYLPEWSGEGIDNRADFGPWE